MIQFFAGSVLVGMAVCAVLEKRTRLTFELLALAAINFLLWWWA